MFEPRTFLKLNLSSSSQGLKISNKGERKTHFFLSLVQLLFRTKRQEKVYLESAELFFLLLLSISARLVCKITVWLATAIASLSNLISPIVRAKQLFKERDNHLARPAYLL